MASTQTEKSLQKDINRIEQRYRMSIRSGVSVCVAREIRAKEMKRYPEVPFNKITGIRSNFVIKSIHHIIEMLNIFMKMLIMTLAFKNMKISIP